MILIPKFPKFLILPIDPIDPIDPIVPAILKFSKLPISAPHKKKVPAGTFFA